MMRLHQLFEDEKDNISAARCGMWLTIVLAVATIVVDILRATNHVPNTVYGLEATMFMSFCSWAAGPRIAQYLAPQIGNAVSGLAAAVRDVRLPSKTDDERQGGM